MHGLPVPKRDRRVLVDHSTLDDAGVFAFGRGEALVQTADFFTPVVDDPYDYGRIAAAEGEHPGVVEGGMVHQDAPVPLRRGEPVQRCVQVRRTQL